MRRKKEQKEAWRNREESRRKRIEKRGAERGKVRKRKEEENE